jgi:hypothetical protein
MNPKDPKWNFYEVTEITKCRECGTVVRAKSDRLKTHETHILGFFGLRAFPLCYNND